MSTAPGPAGTAAHEGDPHQQLALVREEVRRARPAPPDPVAAEAPVARVVVDVSLAHLDRPFDYLVPQSLAASAVPGARVRVRFAGRDLDGFVVERLDSSEHGGRMERLRRVVSPEPVLTPEVLRLARAVADRYAGTLADVLRLAVPPRHAGAEAEVAVSGSGPLAEPEASRWARYAGGAELHAALLAGTSPPPRVVWSALPGPAWADEAAELVLACLSGGRGALLVAPDQRDVDRLDAALTARLGAGRHVALTAGLGPAERYRRFLAVSRRDVRVVLGTRAAVFAPVADLGLVLVWDDGDDSLAEQRSPYPHAREVCLLRASTAAGPHPPALVLGGWAVSAEGALLVQRGWARPVRAERAVVREHAPRVSTPAGSRDGDDPLAVAARLPTAAWRVAREGLERGPVLVQVPRVGYVPALACARCRTPARCTSDEGPLALPAAAPAGAAGEPGGAEPAAAPRCRWCGRGALGWTCRACGDRRLRAVTVGAERTAEELGRAFPRARVVQSSGERTRRSVPARPALVVATPGAEPVAEGGYAAALLLDAALLLSRPALRAQEETYRRWTGAAALVRPATEGGAVVVVADPALPVVQALVRWDPFGAADAELADRGPLALPPTARVAVLSGPPAAVTDALAELRRLLADAGALDGVRTGAVLDVPAPAAPASAPSAAPAEPRAQAMVRAARPQAAALSRALAAVQAVRSARRDLVPVRVQVDPVDLA
ncbi:replication restart DNA helicase PriA [Motilibacter peucedani]|uniref:Probable replication restart protein PriA n=1 Tax=Motilibacter peucedani TaxID=598650 RepID=A0A420XSD1_9ACTN|nr:primosomal protein N' [Motilibacter peucedani]RKS77786.1 replication restart DNA helicase PriA [Motilibacter peucedani]